MSNFATPSNTRPASGSFSPADSAFALAWEVYAPGLTGWTVLVDNDDEGAEIMLVDPPLAYDNGFTLRPDGRDIIVSWSGGQRRASSVREALLLLCPLAPEHLIAADALAAAPL